MHVPPGLLAVLLYWNTEIRRLFSPQPDLSSYSLVKIICVLVISWLAGIMIDAIIFVPLWFALNGFFRFWPSSFSRLILKQLEKKIPASRLEGRPPDPINLREYQLNSAKKIMARSFAGVFFVAWLSSLNFPHMPKLEPLADFPFSASFYFFCSLSFGFLSLFRILTSPRDWWTGESPLLPLGAPSTSGAPANPTQLNQP